MLAADSIDLAPVKAVMEDTFRAPWAADLIGKDPPAPRTYAGNSDFISDMIAGGRSSV